MEELFSPSVSVPSPVKSRNTENCLQCQIVVYNPGSFPWLSGMLKDSYFTLDISTDTQIRLLLIHPTACSISGLMQPWSLSFVPLAMATNNLTLEPSINSFYCTPDVITHVWPHLPEASSPGMKLCAINKFCMPFRN